VAEDLDAIFAKFVVEAEVRISAPPEAVWNLVCDVRRIGEFSPECVGVEWTGGPQLPAMGARFAGTNRWTIDRVAPSRRAGLPDDWAFEWTLPCEVTICDAPRRFAYVVMNRFDGSTPTTEWSFEIGSAEGGSLLTERMRHFPSGRSFTRTQADKHPQRAHQIVQERTAVLRDDIRNTLLSMKGALEAVT
jgi:hypothetical protein